MKSLLNVAEFLRIFSGTSDVVGRIHKSQFLMCN